MSVKISQFIPLAGTIGGFALILLTGLEDVKFSLEPTYIWTYMAICIGGTVAHKASKLKWKQ